MPLKAGLNKGSSGNTHRDWVYENSVFSVEPGKLIVPGSQSLLTPSCVKEYICIECFRELIKEKKLFTHMTAKRLKLHDNSGDFV